MKQIKRTRISEALQLTSYGQELNLKGGYALVEEIKM